MRAFYTATKSIICRLSAIFTGFVIVGRIFLTAFSWDSVPIFLIASRRDFCWKYGRLPVFNKGWVTTGHVLTCRNLFQAHLGKISVIIENAENIDTGTLEIFVNAKRTIAALVRIFPEALNLARGWRLITVGDTEIENVDGETTRQSLRRSETVTGLFALDGFQYELLGVIRRQTWLE